MAKKKKKTEKIIRITLRKSPIGYSERQKGTVKALGLKRMHQSIEHVDTPVMRGMVARIAHLVEVEEIN
jgi:large subunit ribosomal protein L30